ncbi:hypothetical protein D9758_008678 [Tetrapyrgos nigripes]|uniref:F-box domain-containing protein n=1 Tax=Tetrapyrgos nigripes TaxID=182062 RepID=A0A8H5FYS3_9AGAR|nr:hypothetical protein D9758_008678 [Tetrapyrgos nigripes]
MSDFAHLLDEYLSGRQTELGYISSAVHASFQSRLEEEEARIAELSSQVWQLQVEIKRRQHVAAKLKNVLAPIKRVPQEIMAEIFLRYIESGPHCFSSNMRNARLYDMSPSAVFLSQICSRWRGIVHGDPRLWSRLHLRFDIASYLQKVPPKKVIVSWLQRSGSLPIHFSIRISRDQGPYWYSDGALKDSYLDFLVRFSGRLQSLELDTHKRFIQKLFQKARFSLPALEEIIIGKLNIPFSIDPTTMRTIGSVLRKSTKIAKIQFFVRLEHQFPVPTSALEVFPFTQSHQITTLRLEISGLNDSLILRNIMCSCPQLETCEIAHIHGLPEVVGQLLLPSTELSHLRRLSLQFINDSSVQFLSGLHLPALEELRLDSCPDTVLDHLTALHERASFPLRKLDLIADSIGDTLDLVSFLKRIPTLEILILNESGVNVPQLCQHLQATADRKVPVPNLKKLSFLGGSCIPWVLVGSEDDNKVDSDDDDEDDEGIGEGKEKVGLNTEHEEEVKLVSDMALSRWRPYPRDQDVDDEGNGLIKWPVAKMTMGMELVVYNNKRVIRFLQSKLEECVKEGMPLDVYM